MALPFLLVSEETDAQGVKQILQDFVAPCGRVDTPNQASMDLVTALSTFHTFNPPKPCVCLVLSACEMRMMARLLFYFVLVEVKMYKWV